MERQLRIWGLMIFISLLGFTACQEKDSADPDADLSFTSAEFLLEDLDALSKPHLKDGCGDKAFTIHSVATARTERHTLTYILPMLQLESRQAITIGGYAKDHQRATSTHSGSISMLHQEILMRGNAQRDELIKAYNENRINQEQLDERLLALHDRVLAELSENEQKQEHMRVLRQRRAELFHNIETILNGTQLQQWQSWRGSIRS
jgi:hypothetical protein